MPAHGGLISSLNGWENITLPVAYHSPRRLPDLHEEVQDVLDDLGGVDDNLLAKLPEEMTLYEKRLCAYIRALLEKPRLMLTEGRAAASARPSAGAPRASPMPIMRAAPGGTYVQLDE